MKHAHRKVLFFISFILFSGAFGVMSQAQEPQGKKIVRIRRIKLNKLQTPQYKVTNIGQMSSIRRDWAQIDVEYETAPAWIDEMTCTFYVLMKARQAEKGQQPYRLLRGEVTYVNIAKGKHKADMYLHPSTLARYGAIERVAVLMRAEGRLVAMDSQPSSNQRWWEQLTPLDGYVLNHMESPFAMLNFDDYEAIKTGGQR